MKQRQTVLTPMADSISAVYPYVLDRADKLLCEGVLDDSIPSTAAYSWATSGIGTSNDASKCTGRPSFKKFILPGGNIVPATEIAEYPFNIRDTAKELHITPGIHENSLLSTGKFADANYISIFDKEEVNIYDANDTIITVMRGAILRGYRDPKSTL